MNNSELAMRMLEWEKLRQELDALEAEIKTAVLEIGATQTVGNVRASFSNGRKSYDYETAAKGHPMVSNVIVELFTTVPAPVVDWRGICKHAGVDEIPVLSQSEPSVSLKLLG